MDSQITLVTPRYNDTTLVFEFSMDSPKNTAISSCKPGKATYTVESSTTGSKTWVYKIYQNHQKSLLAYIERNSLRHDKITLNGSNAIRLSSWLKSKSFKSL